MVQLSKYSTLKCAMHTNKVYGKFGMLSKFKAFEIRRFRLG